MRTSEMALFVLFEITWQQDLPCPADVLAAYNVANLKCMQLPSASVAINGDGTCRAIA